MVTSVLPELSWQEGMTPAAQRTLAERTVAMLQERLAAPPTSKLLYVAAPNPSAWADAETRLVAQARSMGELTVLSRNHRPNTYCTDSADLFVAVLPLIVDLGPPEVTLLVLVDNDNLSNADVGSLVTTIIEKAGAVSVLFAGLYLDSGDVLAVL